MPVSASSKDGISFTLKASEIDGVYGFITLITSGFNVSWSRS